MATFSAVQGFKSQPRGLTPLFFIELWERFGFYAVQLILVLYLTKVFHLSDSDAYDLYGITSAFTFATPLIGGYIADKILGYRASILLGAVLLMMGYWLLMVPGMGMFSWALALIVIGTGFFKSCISTLLGLLYEPHDARRDAGFTIFYMGINLGSMFGPLMSGYVSAKLGWSFVFGFTGAGLAISFLIAVFTFRMLGDKGLAPAASKMSKILLACGIVVAILLFGWLIKDHALANSLFRIMCAICIVGILVLAFRSQDQNKKNMIALVLFLIFSIAFWAVFAQMYTSVNLFTDRLVDRHLGNFVVPTVWFQSLEGLFIVLFTPCFVMLWNWVDRRQAWLSSGAAKFSVAFFLLAIAFFIWGYSIIYTGHAHQVSMIWVVAGYVFLTMGELCLSPIGLSLFSELAPEHYRGMMMGAWMFSISVGYELGGSLAKLSSVPEAQLGQFTLANIEHYYHHAFSIFMWLSLAAGMVVFFFIPTMNDILGKNYVDSSNTKK